MNQEYLLVLTGILGTLLGAVVVGIINYGQKEREWSNSLRKAEISDRKVLYVKFLQEADKIVNLSLVDPSPVSDFYKITYLVTEIELTSSKALQTKAKNLLSFLLDADTEIQHRDTYHEVKTDLIEAFKLDLENLKNT